MVAVALAPLHARFGLESVSRPPAGRSGAGYPVSHRWTFWIRAGHSSAAKKKMEAETKKILGAVAGDHNEPAPMAVSAPCHRVNVSDGHLAACALSWRAPSLLNCEKLELFYRVTAGAQAAIGTGAADSCATNRIDRSQNGSRCRKGMSVTVGR